MATSVLEKRPGQRAKRPTPAASMGAIRKMGYEGEKQRQITNGWYARGHKNPANLEKYGFAWMPDLGDTDDVFVYLPMSAPHEREFYGDGQPCKLEFADGSYHFDCRQEFIALSDVPNKRAVAGRPSTGEFVIEPPEYDQLDEILALMRLQVKDSVNELVTQITLNEEALSDGGSLMKGEAGQFRKINTKLRARVKRLETPATFETLRIYTAMVHERMSVLKAQQKPDAARHAELQREYGEWEEHLRQISEANPATAQAAASEGAPSKASRTSTATSTRSTPPEEGS